MTQPRTLHQRNVDLRTTCLVLRNENSTYTGLQVSSTGTYEHACAGTSSVVALLRHSHARGGLQVWFEAALLYDSMHGGRQAAGGERTSADIPISTNPKKGEVILSSNLQHVQGLTSAPIQHTSSTCT